MNKQKKIIVIIVSALMIFSALIFLWSARGFSNQGKFVEVKGLSERIVKADRAIWSINFEVKSNSSQNLFNQIQSNTQDIHDFLLDAGFTDDEISTAPANTYQDTYQGSQYRYNASISMSVYTDKVDLVRTTSQNTLSLIQKGIVMTNNAIHFEISDINDIKPAMLKESISNASTAAKQIAENSNSRIGDIARANQGVISITDKDPGSPEYKKIRLVSTVRYLIH